MLQIQPSSLSGTISAPPSKSLTHRVLIASVLANKPSEIINPLISEDTKATIQALELLGVKFSFKQDGVLSVIPPQEIKPISTTIDCRESGSTLRFLIPLILYWQKDATFSGTKRLLNRLNTEDLKQIGIQHIRNASLLKVSTVGFGNQLTMSDSASTQLISGVLLMAPLKKKTMQITILNPVLDPYLDMTLSVMKAFNINFFLKQNSDSLKVFIDEYQNYAPTCFTIEGDYSQMANMLVAGVLGKGVTINNLFFPSVQGDYRIVDILQASGADITLSGSSVSIKKSLLKPIKVDLTQIPDLGPILMGLSATIEGTSYFTGLKRLIKKESNRLLSTIRILNQLGAKTVLKNDSLAITGCAFFAGGITINPDNDHRLAMMVASLASRFEKPVKLTNPQVVAKSYPYFWRDYQTLGGKINWED